MNFRRTMDISLLLARYNLKIIFANKFWYFVLAAFVFFLIVAATAIFDDDMPLNATSVFYQLLFPGILLVFYPTVFGIQNDVDSNMIETLFGIPNYSYKVWLSRMALMWVVVFLMMFVLSVLSSALIAFVPLISMVYHLMFPIFFIGSLAFMISTLIRNGNGTAVIVISIGVVFWIFAGNVERSRWNIFLNPFLEPGDMDASLWASIVLKNRVFLTAGTLLSIMYGLINLQKREKFI